MKNTNRNLLPFALPFLWVFLLLACTDKTKIQTAFPYTASGKVVDSLGNGLPGIQIVNGSGNSVTTDASGSWTFGALLGNQTLTPSNSGFSFLPPFVFVGYQTENLRFTAVKKSPSDSVAVRVYTWFRKIQLPNGLLESSENSNFVSLYDNALAAFVFMANGENSKAEAVFDFFNNRINSEFRVGNGGFSQFRDRNGNPNGHAWMGDNAWLLMALNHHAVTTQSSRYQNLRTAIENWIRNLQDENGAVWGGYGSNGTKLGIVTEGIIDAFNAIPGYDAFHQRTLAYLKANRWDPNRKLLISWPGNKYELALDNHSWGFCAFEDFPVSVLTDAERYLNTQTATQTGRQITGYSPDIDKDLVWLEGTGEMVVAWQKAGNDSLAHFYLNEMRKGIIASPAHPEALGLPYVTNPGTSYGDQPIWTGAEKQPCISSAAWFLFGVYHFDPFRTGAKKQIPGNDKFWMS